MDIDKKFEYQNIQFGKIMNEVETLFYKNNLIVYMIGSFILNNKITIVGIHLTKEIYPLFHHVYKTQILGDDAMFTGSIIGCMNLDYLKNEQQNLECDNIKKEQDKSIDIIEQLRVETDQASS